MFFNETIIFKCLSGSYLYGTNSDKSDKDYKGVFLPFKKDLILQKAPKHYTSSTGNGKDRNTHEDIDETYYSLHYFLELAAKGDTNAIDILFAYTNPNAVIYSHPIWNQLIKNIDKILTKNVQAYLGYCKSQCIKYSIKGEKLNNFNKLKQFCLDHFYNKNIDGSDITLKQLLINKVGIDQYNKWIPKVQCPKIKFTFMDFGDHCYIETADNKESYLVISSVKFALTDTIKTIYHKVSRTIESYGKRAENAATDNGADYKAISHCVRVLLQVEQLLTENKITFPLKEAEFVKSIKYKTIDMTYDQIMEWIDQKINLIDTELLPKSTLREKADYKWIEQFILDQYRD